MLFAHDTEVALVVAAALVNTEQNGGLETVAELGEFVRQHGWTGAVRRTKAELDAVRELRPRLREVWGLTAAGDVDAAVRITNTLLREASALPQLVTHGEWGYHLHATSPDAPLVDRMAVEAAMAFVDVIRTDELDRLRICVSDDCDAVLVDLTKNRSRLFCDFGCGNRRHVAAYRARQASVKT